MSKVETLGTVVARIRADRNWTLKEMSDVVGIPVSTLSKVEHDRLTLTYDKIQQLSQRLKIRMSDLFSDGPDEQVRQAAGRRSVGTLEEAFRVETPNYDYHYFCTDLRRKRMIPIVTKIRAHTTEEFGDFLRHEGEELIYVLEGSIVVHTEFYKSVTLTKGQAIYLDSLMGHAYVTAPGCEEAVVLGVCSSADDEGLMDSLMSLHGENADSAESQPR